MKRTSVQIPKEKVKKPKVNLSEMEQIDKTETFEMEEFDKKSEEVIAAEIDGEDIVVVKNTTHIISQLTCQH